MNVMTRNLGIFLIVLAVISLAMGITFLYQGFSKQNDLVSSMRYEGITFGSVGIKGALENEAIDSASEALQAGDTVREHRHSFFGGTYDDLLAGERFDPSNSQHLFYAQALNLENYLYLAVTAFGLVTVTLASGGFMIVTSLAFGATGFALFTLAKK